MATAGATHNDFSSTVYYTVWCRANYFCALETSPVRLPVVAQVLRVSPGLEVFLFLNADSEGSKSLPTIQEACNQPLTPGHFKIIISEPKSGG